MSAPLSPTTYMLAPYQYVSCDSCKLSLYLLDHFLSDWLFKANLPKPPLEQKQKALKLGQQNSNKKETLLWFMDILGKRIRHTYQVINPHCNKTNWSCPSNPPPPPQKIEQNYIICKLRQRLLTSKLLPKTVQLEKSQYLIQRF